MMLILARLLANWRLVAGGAVLVAFLAVGSLAYVRGKEVQSLETQKSSLADQVKGLGAQVDAQNRAVLDLKKASDAQAQRAADAAKTAQNALQAANARARALAVVSVPTACPEALEWLRAQAVADESAREAQ